MSKFVILRPKNPTSTDFTEFHVHAAGCRDTRNGSKYWDAEIATYLVQEADTAEDLVAAEVQVYTDQDQGWTAEDHRIFPCCKDA